MTFGITFGNLLTILIIIIGFIYQHISLIERVAKLEVRLNNTEKDVSELFEFIRALRNESKWLHRDD